MSCHPPPGNNVGQLPTPPTRPDQAVGGKPTARTATARNERHRGMTGYPINVIDDARRMKRLGPPAVQEGLRITVRSGGPLGISGTRIFPVAPVADRPARYRQMSRVPTRRAPAAID